METYEGKGYDRKKYGGGSSWTWLRPSSRASLAANIECEAE